MATPINLASSHSGGKRVLIISGFYNPDIISGFCRYALQAGWTINPLAILTGVYPHKWKADGVLTTNLARPDLLRYVRKLSKEIPVVLHGSNDLGIPVSLIECDEIAIGRLAAEHLLDQGHRTFVYLNTSSGTDARRRFEGFEKRLQASNRTCEYFDKISPERVLPVTWFKRRLKKLKPPVALFAIDDIIGAMAIDAALEMGWRVPQDLAVVGVGNNRLIAGYSQVPITSVQVHNEDQAYQAAALLDELMSGSSTGLRSVIVPPGDLIPRGSTDSLVARAPIVQRTIEFMIQNLADPNLDSKNLARAACVSVTLLYKHFHDDVGHSPIDYLNRIRIRHAKQLIRAREKIVGIYERCGFGSLRSFQRTFQRLEGVSPQDWRSQHR